MQCPEGFPVCHWNIEEYQKNDGVGDDERLRITGTAAAYQMKAWREEHNCKEQGGGKSSHRRRLKPDIVGRTVPGIAASAQSHKPVFSHVDDRAFWSASERMIEGHSKEFAPNLGAARRDLSAACYPCLPLVESKGGEQHLSGPRLHKPRPKHGQRQHRGCP